MPEKKIQVRVRKAKEAGKAPSTQAGEFVREEMEKVHKGSRQVRSRKQAIAIGLSKARRAGVDLPPPKKGKTSAVTRRKAIKDIAKGRAQSKLAANEASGSPVSRKRLSARSRAALSRRTQAQRLGTAARTKARLSVRRGGRRH